MFYRFPKKAIFRRIKIVLPLWGFKLITSWGGYLRYKKDGFNVLIPKDQVFFGYITIFIFLEEEFLELHHIRHITLYKSIYKIKKRVEKWKKEIILSEI